MNNALLKQLIEFISKHDGIGDKAKLAAIVNKEFSLTQDRSVYYRPEFAIRFSSAKNESFSNTVLSLSNLQKVDDRPFLVCLVTPRKNQLLLANSTFLRKISHSSQELRENNIRGSFNGSDIMRDFEGISNFPANFERLYNIHEGIGFDGNLLRLVDATNNISPTGKKYMVSAAARTIILEAPIRALEFTASPEFLELKRDLDEKVDRFRNEILLAALIENVNVRGRIIEYLIAGEDDRLRQDLVAALRDRGKGLPQFKTENALGDYARVFEQFSTETDVKTKIMILDSNPKAYNLDKMLEFLATPKSVFMLYFVGVDPHRIVNTVLVSMFQKRLLSSTILLKHWAGRNSRGVSQFEGKTIGSLILSPDNDIDMGMASTFLEKIIEL
ncbi:MULTISPECIES: hypothetical protein [unclassified Methylococcus]|uniref:hypothetical protein n=1 Tax=unclassified Methylococcus TaxID=2618889 RepID=UPI003D7EA4F7